MQRHQGATRGRTKEQEWRAGSGERQAGRVNRECGRELIKHRVRYPSVPGSEFDQLSESGVRGEGVRRPDDPARLRGQCAARRYTGGRIRR